MALVMITVSCRSTGLVSLDFDYEVEDRVGSFQMGCVWKALVGRVGCGGDRSPAYPGVQIRAGTGRYTKRDGSARAGKEGEAEERTRGGLILDGGE